MPEVAPVSGTLTLDGAPISGASISFYPTSGGKTVTAVSDEQGAYTLQYSIDAPGATIGENEVTITTLVQERVDDDGKVTEEGRAEEIPKKYDSEKLKVNVENKENTIDLTLTSS